MVTFASMRAPGLGRCGLLIVLLLVQAGAVAPASADSKNRVAFRRPVAVVATADRLFVANQRSGTISVLECPGGAVIDEVPAGKQLSDLAILPDHDLLATDSSAGQLIRLHPAGNSLRVVRRFSVGFSPVSVCPAPDGSWCAVALLWARRLALVDLKTGRTRATVDLPFAPRKQCLLPDGNTLVAADSFGRTLAVIDVPTARVRALRSVQGHNIRGMAVGADGSRLLLSHPMLSPTVSTTDSNIFWGSVVGNAMRSIPIDNLGVDPETGRAVDPTAVVPIGHWALYPIGEQGHAAGDPGALLALRDGSVLICLGGVDELAVLRPHATDFDRLPVGRRPTALAVGPDQKTVFVANTLDDSISVIDLSTLRTRATFSLGTQPEPTPADLGERLFYDSRLSRDGWYSCNTCHTEGHTCGLLNDNFSDGTFGTPKRVLSLGGAGATGPWAWDGHHAGLEDQIRSSIELTMRGKPGRVSASEVANLAAFVRTLAPPPSPAAARGELDAAAVERGRRAFEQWDCDHCHAPPTYTSPRTYDIGLRDEAGQTRWNPPSLRGVGQLPAFFHDNRAASLRDVFLRYKHPNDQEIPESQVDDIVSFLESL